MFWLWLAAMQGNFVVPFYAGFFVVPNAIWYYTTEALAPVLAAVTWLLVSRITSFQKVLLESAGEREEERSHAAEESRRALFETEKQAAAIEEQVPDAPAPDAAVETAAFPTLLVECEACGREVSRRATACPYCGDPNQGVGAIPPSPSVPQGSPGYDNPVRHQAWAREFFSLRGRATRMDCWGILGWLAAINLLLWWWGFGMAEAEASNGSSGVLAAGFLLFVGVLIVVSWIWIAVNVRRLHDRDREGWWLLVGLIPILGNLWLLIELGFLAGTPGLNRFGPEEPTGSEYAKRSLEDDEDHP